MATVMEQKNEQETQPDPKSSDPTKPCVYCGSSMSVGARLSPVCRSYQSPWRTAVTYIAGIAGLLSLLASALIFVVGKAPDVYKLLHWNDQVLVWSFDTGLYPDFSLTLSNTGDGPVIVSQIFVILPDGRLVGYPIAQTLPAGQSILIAGGQVFSPHYLGYIYNQSGRASATLLRNAGQPWPDQNVLPCFGEILFSENSLLLGRTREYYRTKTDGKLVEDTRSQAFVVYYSLHDKKEVRYPFPVITTFVQSSDPKCQSPETSG